MGMGPMGMGMGMGMPPFVASMMPGGLQGPFGGVGVGASPLLPFPPHMTMPGASMTALAGTPHPTFSALPAPGTHGGTAGHAFGGPGSGMMFLPPPTPGSTPFTGGPSGLQAYQLSGAGTASQPQPTGGSSSAVGGPATGSGASGAGGSPASATSAW